MLSTTDTLPFSEIKQNTNVLPTVHSSDTGGNSALFVSKMVGGRKSKKTRKSKKNNKSKRKSKKNNKSKKNSRK
jgi:hypothetical protein